MYRNRTQIKDFLRIFSGIFCPICIAYRNRSKRFSSTQALLWHIQYTHGNEPQMLDASVEEIKEIIRKFDKAIEIGIVRRFVFPQVERSEDG